MFFFCGAERAFRPFCTSNGLKNAQHVFKDMSEKVLGPGNAPEIGVGVKRGSGKQRLCVPRT
jgi:hypothetical protein